MAPQHLTKPGVALALVALLCCLGSLNLAAAQYDTVVDAAANTTSLSTLVSLLGSAGLIPTLNSSTLNATVFAPTNAAFNSALSSLNLTAAQLEADNATLTSLLEYHVVPGALTTDQLATLGGSIVAYTLAGPPLLITADEDGGVVVNATGSDADVTTANVTAGSAVVHIIDNVLLPFYTSVAQAAVKNNLTILVAALNQANLISTFQDPNLVSTVFAPTDEAFNATLTALGFTTEDLLDNEQLLTDILTYHVVVGTAYTASDLTNGTVLSPLLEDSSLVALNNGSTVAIGGLGSAATVIIPDLSVVLGRSIVHVIDNVLLPFYPNVAAAAASSPNLSILVQALDAADLVDTFSNDSLVATVFAPNNAAFANALTALNITADDLLNSEDGLTTILNYHVVPDVVLLSSQITDGQQITTAGGLVLNATVNSSGVYLNAQNSTAKVVTADILTGANRSVVHIIDAVLLPNNATQQLGGAAAVATPGVKMMLAALLGAAGLLLLSAM